MKWIKIRPHQDEGEELLSEEQLAEIREFLVDNTGHKRASFPSWCGGDYPSDDQIGFGMLYLIISQPDLVYHEGDQRQLLLTKKECLTFEEIFSYGIGN